MNPLNTAPLVKPLRTDLNAERAGGAAAGAAPVAFAGLLGEQQGRWSKEGGGSAAYDGSAFDVAPARRETVRPATPQLAKPSAAPTPAPTRPNEPSEQDPSASERQASRPAPGAGAPSKTAPKPADARRDAGSAEAADRPRDETAADAAAAGAAPASAGPSVPTEDATPGAQALIEWMARWSAPASDGSAPGGAQALPGAASAPAADAAAASAAALPGATLLSAATAAAASAASDDAPAALEAAGEAGAQAPVAAPARPAGMEAAASLLAPQAAAASPASASASIVLPTPVDAPDFSQALASQLTTLARQGVHEAQLQLNPADMGPISVQITLDGSQAQIDFAATHARTRDALEAAWPALAASLHGAGLTLGGGGVSDQRAGTREGGDTPGRGTAAGAGGDDVADPAAPRSVRIDAQRGLLDLYA